MKKQNVLWLFLLLFGSIWIIRRHQTLEPFQNDSGMVFGTLYKLTYQHPENLKAEVEEALARFDGSLSPFNDTATISRINRGEEVLPDSFFLKVFRRSQEISALTQGAFDITVAPLVNAWGFGFKKGRFPDSLMIDSLREFVGWQKVSLDASGRVEKQDPRLMLDCSAIAKGYAVDVVADLLQRHGVRNLMVDIGGEVVVRGQNPKGQPWHIGINRPVEDSLSQNQELQMVLQLSEVGIATSGNYRNFYYRDGRKYAHTIDPRTGYPVQHQILSATVIAPDCLTADALATSFMVMGLQEAEAFTAQHPELDACFIYADSTGVLKTFLTPGMQKYQ